MFDFPETPSPCCLEVLAKYLKDIRAYCCNIRNILMLLLALNQWGAHTCNVLFSSETQPEFIEKDFEFSAPAKRPFEQLNVKLFIIGPVMSQYFRFFQHKMGIATALPLVAALKIEAGQYSIRSFGNTAQWSTQKRLYCFLFMPWNKRHTSHTGPKMHLQRAQEKTKI